MASIVERSRRLTSAMPTGTAAADDADGADDNVRRRLQVVPMNSLASAGTCQLPRGLDGAAEGVRPKAIVNNEQADRQVHQRLAGPCLRTMTP